MGIVGAGGAGFPTYAKLNSKAESILLNCAECEPLLRLHRQLLKFHAPVIIEAFDKTREVLGAKEGIVCIKDHYKGAIEAVTALLQKYPKLKILGHSQPFWSEIGDNVNEENRNTYVSGKVQEGRLPYLLREYENLYCDLSAGSGANALMRDRDYAAKFIEEFSDRLMYGTDICMHGQTFPFAFDEFLTSMRESGEISEENYYKLVRGNACRLLGIQ
jgi:predicted TIM-barrel fold metal-dependent hydrolase